MDNIELMINEESIKNRIDELANQINKDYKDEELLVVCILKGSTLFTCDLIKKIKVPVILDFMIASSYNDKTESSGNVEIIKDLDNSIMDKNVLLIDDIIDSGRTLSSLVKTLNNRNPKTLKLCTLLDKPERRVVDVSVDYVGFEIENEFVVGYGLDYDQKYRNLPYVGKIMKKEL